jgi:hypothetical protein
MTNQVHLCQKRQRQLVLATLHLDCLVTRSRPVNRHRRQLQQPRLLLVGNVAPLRVGRGLCWSLLDLL